MTHDQFQDWYNKLPILTYGELEDLELLAHFKTILSWKADDKYISDEIPNNKFTVLEYWLLLGLLHECIDYGTSPRGAWLNAFGKDVLQFLTDVLRVNSFQECQ